MKKPRCKKCTQTDHIWGYIQILVMLTMIALAVYTVYYLPDALETECCVKYKENLKTCAQPNQRHLIGARNPELDFLYNDSNKTKYEMRYENEETYNITDHGIDFGM